MNIQNNLLTINKMSRPGSKLKSVNKIIIHYVGNPNTSAIQNRNYFENLKNQNKTYASAHYIVGLEGEIVYCVPEDEVTWNSGNYDVNFESIAIENCHFEKDGKFNDKTLASLKELVADICKRHNLDPLVSIYRHSDIIKTSCPKYYVDNPNEWDKFKNDVKKMLEGESGETVRGEKYFVNATLGLNVRSGADISSNIVTAYPYQAEITIYEIQNGWGRTKDGWVSMQWVGKENQNQGEEYRITATLGLNARKSADINSQKVTTYPYNTIITIYEIQNGWGRTDEGWVSLNWVTKIMSVGNSYKVIATLGLNIRSGPSMEDRIVGAYKYNTIIIVYETQNGWGRTEDGWISMDWINKV